MTRHRQRWDTVYVPWCAQQDPPHDPYAYDIVQVVNFLESEQLRFERGQDALGRSHNHSGFKESRAAVVSFLQIIYPHLPRISDHHLVKSIASELRKSAPNLPKYVETIPLDPLFLYLIHLYQSGSRFDTMPLIDLRDIAMLLLRVKVHGRSADVAVINRSFACMHDEHAGLVGSPVDFTVTAVRYDFNKTWKAAGSRFSAWKTLGGYLQDAPGFRPEFSLCCARSAVEFYLRRTYSLPLQPWVDKARPLERVFRLFVTTTRACGRFAGLSPDTVSNRIKRIMLAAGIDVAAFQPHILRSASMRAAIDAGEAVDAVLQRASVSLKVFKVYYDLPKGGESSGGVESLDGEAAARLLLDLQPRSVPSSPPVSRAQPLLANG
jgi:hypothetical protein